MEEICVSFAPVAASGCRVLLLGSMPGVASLRAQQYYAHPRNAFWPILYALWDMGPPAEAYASRISFAQSHHIAIWDVAHTCRREGSSDASIRDVRANDFAALFARHPSLQAIFFNGRQAESMFNRLVKGSARDVPCTLLPSTSPAYTLPFGQKLAAWRCVRGAAEQRGV